MLPLPNYYRFEIGSRVLLLKKKLTRCKSTKNPCILNHENIFFPMFVLKFCILPKKGDSKNPFAI